MKTSILFWVFVAFESTVITHVNAQNMLQTLIAKIPGKKKCDTTPSPTPVRGAAPAFVPCVSVPTILYRWDQVGEDIDGGTEDGITGLSISLSSAGARIAIGGDLSVKIYDSFSLVSTGTTGWNIAGNLGSFFSDYVVSVALSSSGVYLVAGQQSTIGKRFVGSVLVFQSSGFTWTQVGDTLEGGDDDGFGRAVDISDDGTVVAVGAPDGKYASVYQLDGLTWSLKLSQSSGDFGWSVSLTPNGKYVAMGAPAQGTFTPGSAYVYELEGNTLIQKLDGTATGDNFGKSVSLSDDGTRLAVGAPGADYVKLYDSFDMSSYIAASYTLTPTAINTNFGNSVSLSGDGSTLAVGAPGDDEGGSDVGKTFIYKVSSCDFDMTGEITGESESDNAGYSVSMSSDGSQVAFSAINNEGIFTELEGDFNAGHVRVYKSTIGL